MLNNSLGFEFSVALRYLRAKRKQGFISLVGFLSVAGVSVGVMALVIVIAVMSGAEKDLRKRILGMEPHLILNSKSGPFLDYKDLCAQIKKNNNVVEALPYLSGEVMLRSKWGLKGTIIRGIDISSNKQVIKGLSAEKTRALLDNKNSKNHLIILGKGVADNLGVGKGDYLYAMTSDWNVSPVGLMPSLTEIKVAGIFKSGLFEYDNAIAYMTLEGIQSLIGMKNKVTGVGVYIKDIYKAQDTGHILRDEFDNRFWMRTWMELNQSLFSALKLEKTAMFIILTLIILVAAFNIASSLIMLVMEKTREISIMKTMGATQKSIKRIFVIQGTIIGTAGTFIGIASGVVVSLLLRKYEFIKLPDAYPFSTLPVELEFYDVAFIALSAVLICFFSTLYPAVQAAKLDPVEGIRYGD